MLGGIRRYRCLELIQASTSSCAWVQGISSSFCPCMIITGALTCLRHSRLSNRWATRVDNNQPTTAAAASWRVLNGDIIIINAGCLYRATCAAILHPIERPIRKMSFGFTLRTLTEKSKTVRASSSTAYDDFADPPNSPYPRYSIASTRTPNRSLKADIK